MALFTGLPASKKHVLLFMAMLNFGSTVAMQGWTMLYNNFVVNYAGLTPAQSGLVQGLREIPGLLGVTLIFFLFFIKEHRLAALSVMAAGLGTMLTGFFPSFVPIIFTSMLMSFGFHFFEAVNQSLLLQYFDVRTTPVVMGKLRGLAAGGSLAASVFVFFCSDFLPYTMMFLIVGALCMFTGVWGLFLDPTNKELPIQSKKMVFRRKYWLFYLLTLFLGARRQIFIVFALFLLVEHFRFSVNTVSVLFMINYAINWFLNPLIGRTINRIGERKLLSIEYSTAILVFTGYATTGSAWVAGVLYVIDYIVFNFSIALRTFFQKIAEPQDIAPTMAVAQTINHIAAIFVPALGGWLWVEFGYQIPFFIGAALSGCSLLLVQIIDREIRLHAPAKA